MNHFARRIRTSVQRELDAAREADSQGLAQIAFVHLERAHVLGQASTVEHVRVHLRMFGWAARHRKTGEALGQLWPIACSRRCAARVMPTRCAASLATRSPGWR